MAKRIPEQSHHLSVSNDLCIDKQSIEEDKTLDMLISVVICTYNRASILGRVLDSIKAQSLTPELYEVIVVDNNSTDNTREIIKEYESKIPKFM